uniref:Uncharacterized protein n=1 Tax=Anguilla anguilla TaxID=7936 RepID=A0A0E9RWX2_ANGAN
MPPDKPHILCLFYSDMYACTFGLMNAHYFIYLFTAASPTDYHINHKLSIFPHPHGESC